MENWRMPHSGLMNVADRCEAAGRHDEAEAWRAAARTWSQQQADNASSRIVDAAVWITVGAALLYLVGVPLLMLFGDAVARWLQ